LAKRTADEYYRRFKKEIEEKQITKWMLNFITYFGWQPIAERRYYYEELFFKLWTGN
jgi:hypothetical protein